MEEDVEEAAGRGRSSPLGQLDVFFHPLLSFISYSKYDEPYLWLTGRRKEVEKALPCFSTWKNKVGMSAKEIWTLWIFLKDPNIVISSDFVCSIWKTVSCKCSHGLCIHKRNETFSMAFILD